MYNLKTISMDFLLVRHSFIAVWEQQNRHFHHFKSFSFSISFCLFYLLETLVSNASKSSHLCVAVGVMLCRSSSFYIKNIFPKTWFSLEILDEMKYFFNILSSTTSHLTKYYWRKVEVAIASTLLDITVRDYSQAVHLMMIIKSLLPLDATVRRC